MKLNIADLQDLLWFMRNKKVSFGNLFILNFVVKNIGSTGYVPAPMIMKAMRDRRTNAVRQMFYSSCLSLVSQEYIDIIRVRNASTKGYILHVYPTDKAIELINDFDNF